MSLRTEADVAAEFGLSVEKVAELRKRKGWPHVRLTRFDVRYTDEQVAAIVAMNSVTAPKEPPAKKVSASGQTARSAARRRSA